MKKMFYPCLVGVGLILLAGALAWSQETPAPGTQAQGEMEVVIKGEESKKLSSQKPPPEIPIDENETMKKTLEVDESLFLTQPFLLRNWKQTHPPRLYNTGVIEPWKSSLAQSLQFDLMDRLNRVARSENSNKTPILWTLTIVDQEGQVFQRFEGTGRPPNLLAWNGQNDRKDWIEAGQTYSTIFAFKDPLGVPFTDVGEPLELTNFVHPGARGIYIDLDSRLIFGTYKNKPEIDSDEGKNLIKASADHIKGSYFQIPLTVEVHGENPASALGQAQALKSALLKELIVPDGLIEVSAQTAPFAQRRAKIMIHTK